MTASSINDMFSKPYLVRLSPIPSYYHHQDPAGAFFGFYNGWWWLRRSAGKINLFGLGTGYTIDIEPEHFISWQADGDLRQGQATATVELSGELHLWNSCAHFQPTSIRFARGKAKQQAEFPELVFNFDAELNRAHLRAGYAMETKWRSFYPKHAETWERIPEFWLAARGVRADQLVAALA